LVNILNECLRILVDCSQLSKKSITTYCLVLPPKIVTHDAYIGGRFRWTKITHKASDMAENLQLYRVVRFFHPRPSCMTTHISADVQRITLNASCMTISGGRTKQLDIFCHVAGFISHFLSFIVVELIRFFHGALQMLSSLASTSLVFQVWWRCGYGAGLTINRLQLQPQPSRLRNDLYCVEWDVKLYYTINPSRELSVTLGRSLTHTCLCHQAV